jgi:type IV pilus assembly protein PilV
MKTKKSVNTTGRNAIRRDKGFTLIEVLVSVLILSLGLLGVAGLQTFSLRSNQSAFYRSQATAAAYDIIDRMRANAQGVTGGNYNALDSANLPADPDCITSGCTASELADYDIRDWANHSLASLPSGSGTVTVDDMGTAADSSDDVFVVTVRWTDATDQTNPNKSLAVRVRL